MSLFVRKTLHIKVDNMSSDYLLTIGKDTMATGRSGMQTNNMTRKGYCEDVQTLSCKALNIYVDNLV